MVHFLDTVRLVEDEDTGLFLTRRCVMPYVDMCGPMDDLSAEFPKYTHVTGFYDVSGEQVLVLEPFQKVLDGWMLYLEQAQHKPISFSQQ